jgi:ubiquinone/menaquinone biosynthesis C-methylase UbiE
MIKDVYKDIPQEIIDVLGKLIPDSDQYHKTHERRFARTLQLILEKKPTGKILELGTSHVLPIALELLGVDAEVHVTDFMPHLPPKDMMSLEANGFTREVQTYRLDLETELIPVENETFDMVICSEVIEHMEVDPQFMLAEINRVTKPEGSLILTTPNVTSSRGIWKILRGYEPYFYMQYRHGATLYRHNYEYSLPTLRRVLSDSGFIGKMWTEDTFEDPVHDDVPRLRELGYKLELVGDNIFAVMWKSSPVMQRYSESLYAD